MRVLKAFPKEASQMELMNRGLRAVKQDDSPALKDVLQHMGELGNCASAPFVTAWLSNRILSMWWSNVLRGIAERYGPGEPGWRDEVFRVLEQGLADPSTPNLFLEWPDISWPKTLMSIDSERALRAFIKLKLLVPNTKGFSATVTAIVESSSVVPAEIADNWLPVAMPDLTDQAAGEQYLLMLRAHAKYDLSETSRRLLEVMGAGEQFRNEAAILLFKAELSADPERSKNTRVFRESDGDEHAQSEG